MPPTATPAAEAATTPRDPMPGVLPPANVTIHVGSGVIFCTPQGGNVRVYRSRAERSIRWRSDTPFKLTFTTFDDASKPEWPFVEPEPTWPVQQFTGTPPRDDGAPLYYKYSISAGDLFLDPIVIVDK